jgi:protocatechuate 4,5-dioxygenase alpha chain
MPTTHTEAVSAHRPIPGTPVFDGDAARKGLALNAMCYSFILSLIGPTNGLLG